MAEIQAAVLPMEEAQAARAQRFLEAERRALKLGSADAEWETKTAEEFETKANECEQRLATLRADLVE